jgi:hypothetical protein
LRHSVPAGRVTGEENIQSVDDSRNITKNCQEDVDQQVGAAATLKVFVSLVQPGRDCTFLTSRKTPRGGRMMARMILQMSLGESKLLAVKRGATTVASWRVDCGRETYLAWKAMVRGVG